MRYVALLRGINVGGNTLIKMDALKECVAGVGLEDVSTYIASGNVLFESTERDRVKLDAKLERAIERRFELPVKVVVLNRSDLGRIVRAVPAGGIGNEQLRVTVAFALRAADTRTIAAGLRPKDGIDELVVTSGALLFATRRDALTRTGIKLVGRPDSKQLTLRNLNTTLKLNELLAR